MNLHSNARTTPRSRAEMVRRMQSGEAARTVAAAFGVDVKVARKWKARSEAEGRAGLEDRSSRPRRLRNPTPAQTVEQIVVLRRQRFTGKQIAQQVGVSPATVSRVLRRARLSRAKDLDPPPPVVRYEREKPGELIHIDIKKLGRFQQPGHRVTGNKHKPSRYRGSGWEYVHVCVDDASRIAYSQILPSESKSCAITFLKAALAYYRSLGVTVQRVMTDNGGCYRSNAFQKACRQLGLKHKFTKPYTPRTNGKAERFIQSALREWAYAKTYLSSDQRADELPTWLHRYNWHRPHGGIESQTPISRLRLDRDNLLRLHS
jgi:transposase InsO family protein